MGNNVFAIANQKGGVGKTTTTVNLAACVADRGQKVLLIDVDPQGNATSGVGIDKATTPNTIYEMMLGGLKADEVIQKDIFKNLDVIPANVDFAGAEIELIDIKNREYVLQDKIKKINKELKIDGIIFTMADMRTNLTDDVIKNVRENVDIRVYETVIPRNVRLAEAPSHGLPINLYDVTSKGAHKYKQLANEFLKLHE